MKPFSSPIKINFDAFLFKRVDGLGLGIFRFVFSIVLFYEILHYIRFQEIVFAKIPFVDRGEILYTFLLKAWAVAVILLMVGFFTRIAAVVNYLFSVIIFSGASAFEYHIFYSYVGVSFLMAILPVSRRFSLDNLVVRLSSKDSKELIPQYDVPVLSYYVPILLGIGLVYFDSIFFKLSTKIWMTSIGMWMPASLPQAVWNDTSWLLNQKFLVGFLNYFVIAFEATFIFLMWKKKFRIPLLIVGFIFHIGIYMQYPIPYFATAYMAMYLLFMPNYFWFWMLGWVDKLRLFLGFSGRNTSSGSWSVILNDHFSAPLKTDFKGDFTFSTIPFFNRVARGFWVFLLVFIIFLQLIITWFSPYCMKFRMTHPNYFVNGFTARVMNPLYQNLSDFSMKSLGITHHGVFVDWHFKGFNHIVKVKFLDASGKEHHVPILTDEGMVDDMVSGITWRNIAFNVLTSQLRKDFIENGIVPYLKLFVQENNLSLEGGKFNFYCKRIEVPKVWEPNHLKEQLAKPWFEAGSCSFKQGSPQFSWNPKMVETLEKEKENPFK